MWLEVFFVVYCDYWEKNFLVKIVEIGFKLIGVEVMFYFVVVDEKDAVLV